MGTENERLRAEVLEDERKLRELSAEESFNVRRELFMRFAPCLLRVLVSGCCARLSRKCITGYVFGFFWGLV